MCVAKRGHGDFISHSVGGLRARGTGTPWLWCLLRTPPVCLGTRGKCRRRVGWTLNSKFCGLCAPMYIYILFIFLVYILW